MKKQIKVLTKIERDCIKARNYGFKQGIKKAEQFKKELDELQEAYDIAMKEIARLRAKLYGESKC